MLSWCEWDIRVCILSNHSPLSSISVFQKVSKLNETILGIMQFDFFEKKKHECNIYKFHIEWEKLWFLFNNIHVLSCLCVLLILQQARLIISRLASASENLASRNWSACSQVYLYLPMPVQSCHNNLHTILGS